MSQNTSQQVLCVSKKLYYEIENIFFWSFSHLGDKTLPISVQIQTKLLLKFFTMLSSKNNFCPDVSHSNHTIDVKIFNKLIVYFVKIIDSVHLGFIFIGQYYNYYYYNYRNNLALSEFTLDSGTDTDKNSKPILFVFMIHGEF